MPNLLKNVQSSFKETFNDKLAIAFMALVLVVAINHIVFSYLLFERDQAKAFTTTGVFSTLWTTFGDQTINAGTNDVVLAEFTVPDAWAEDSLTCNYLLSGNPCTTFIDGDGSATTTAGSADDPVNNFLEFADYIPNATFTTADGVCTDSLDPNVAPVTCVYIDSSDGTACDGTTTDAYLLGNGCAAAADSLVSSPTSFYGAWVHVDSVGGTVGAYDDGEDIYIMQMREDQVLARGSYWENIYPNQAQGDVAGSWLGLGNPGGEGFIDLDPGYGSSDGVFQGSQGSPQEPAVIDLDGDSLFTNNPDELIEADGSATAGIGTDDDNLDDGDSLTYLAVSDNVCVNSLWAGPVSPNMIIYVDGDGDCVPSSTDTLLRDDTGNGMTYIANNFGTWPYTFFNGANLFLYYDADSSNSYTYGAGADVTESLWLEIDNVNYWHPNIEGSLGGLLEADGTASTGVGTNDDPVARGTNLVSLSPSEDVCASQDFSGGLEDIYIDGDNDCTPGSGGTDVILLDASSDGLNASTALGGTWANLGYSATYYDHTPSNGSYDYGAGAASTESLWLPLWPSATYSSSADVKVQNIPGGVAGDTLLDLSTALGPNGQPLIYADSDSSGSLTSNDTVLEDVGNVQTGPAGVPNGVIDRQRESFNRATFFNNGSAPLTDLTNMRFYADVWFLGSGDGNCDSSDVLVGGITSDSAGNFLTNFSDIGYPRFYTGCLVADINPDAYGGTVNFGIHQLVDNNSNGLYDNGDFGWFSWSGLDGPTDGYTLAPDTFTINPLYKRGKKEIEPIVKEDEPSAAPEPSPFIDLPTGIEVGDLLKTENEPTVYLVTAESKLRIFPNEVIYYSYYTDFSNLKIVSQDIINQITLGNNVTLRAGTYLMTTPSSEKVYAIEPSGVARWLETGEIAEKLYGPDWQARVVDLADILLEDYVIGDSIDSLIHPTATLLQYAGMSEIYYIEAGNARLVSQEVFEANNFRDEFVVKNVDGAVFDYQIVSPLGEFVDFFMALEQDYFKPSFQR